jgi:hypothetical protein
MGTFESREHLETPDSGPPPGGSRNPVLDPVLGPPRGLKLGCEIGVLRPATVSSGDGKISVQVTTPAPGHSIYLNPTLNPKMGLSTSETSCLSSPEIHSLTYNLKLTTRPLRVITTC